MKHILLVAFCLGTIGATAFTANGAPEPVPGRSSVEEGRYLVTIAGCNDCHTANWAENNGAVAETDWLTGIPIGWRGPWGTSYASNLRLVVHDMAEDDWVAMLKTRNGFPPMPWMNVNRLSERDARAIYRFIASLGPKGERMPTTLPPDRQPLTPFILMEAVAPK